MRAAASHQSSVLCTYAPAPGLQSTLAQDCAQTLYSWKAETPERQTFPFLVRVLFFLSLSYPVIKLEIRTLTPIWLLSTSLTIKKSVNLQYNTLGRLDHGTNESSTKRLIFQVSFFFMISCKILCKNRFNLFSYFFIKLQKQK